MALNFSFQVWGWFVGFGLLGGKVLAVLVQHAAGRILTARKIRAAPQPAV